MGARRDLTGIRYTRLVAVEVVGKRRNRPLWRLVCDCGGEAFGLAGELECGTPRSCGCLHVETARAQGKNNGSHGGTADKDRLYNVWAGMKQRCYDVNFEKYSDYGARGITICDEWRDDYAAFREWSLANGHDKSLTIDRIDNDKGYSPDNCRWADRFVQMNNRRNTVWVEYQGERITLSNAARACGINRMTLWDRAKKGLVGDDLFRPVK